jgi:hypothetical protein
LVTARIVCSGGFEDASARVDAIEQGCIGRVGGEVIEEMSDSWKWSWHGRLEKGYRLAERCGCCSLVGLDTRKFFVIECSNRIHTASHREHLQKVIMK